MVGGAVQTRVVRPHVLWMLESGAQPSVEGWQEGRDLDLFRGSHAGYERLPSPVRLTRTVALDRARHAVVIEDVFIGAGLYHIAVPYHLAPDVDVEAQNQGSILLHSG